MMVNNTADGSEIRQSRFFFCVGYAMIYKVFYIPTGANFFHEQYLDS